MTETDGNEATRQGRMEKAKQFHLAAQVIEEYAAGEEDLNDAYITLCVHAGIAAADVICCARLGKHHQGQNHHGAISLLEHATSKARARARASHAFRLCRCLQNAMSCPCILL